MFNSNSFLEYKLIDTLSGMSVSSFTTVQYEIMLILSQGQIIPFLTTSQKDISLFIILLRENHRTSIKN